MNISNLTGEKILLLGGAGFIGHNLALELVSRGAEVTIVDGFSVNSIINLTIDTDEEKDILLYRSFLEERIKLLKKAGVNLIPLDVSNRYQLAKILDFDYSVVYLLAAVAHASRADSSPVGAIENSLVPFINTITELSERPEVRLVFLSSSTVYGNFEKETVDESDICKPFGMYAVMKHVSEQLLTSTAEKTNLNFCAVRPSALYGERCISRRVSQIFLENAFSGRKLLFKGQPDERLDFTYIKDLVSGLVLAGFNEKAKGEILNITYGDAQPVLKLIDILKEFFPDLTLEIQPRNQATPVRGTLSNQKAKKILGFNPEWHLDEGYRNYINWYLSRSKNERMVLNSISQANE